MAGGRARAAASKLKASVKTEGGLLDSLWVPDSSSTVFNGSSSASEFKGELGGADGSPAFFQAGGIRKTEDDMDMDMYVEAEMEEGCSQLSGKKRRLSTHQVQLLERSFEVENRLEPERKVQLAKDLRLQPRQVAIWFQNRRARFKTKQMEKDYDSLKACYDNLKANYDILLNEKAKLKHEVDTLKNKLIAGDDLTEEKNPPPESISSPPGEPTELAEKAGPKPQEDATTSAKSDVFDSESPCSPRWLDQESSEIEDGSSLTMIGKSLLGYLPRVEDVYNCGEQPVDYTSCSFGFTTEDHPFWNWTY